VSRFLFGRYFFVKMREGWEAILNMRFVSHILLSPKLQPLLIKDAIIDKIKSREIAGAIPIGFQRGQRVIPRIGHLAGVEGKFFRSGGNRDVAMFDILGTATLVDFALGVLEVIEFPVVKKRRRHVRRRLVIM
jgi:hypothetical protein